MFPCTQGHCRSTRKFVHNLNSLLGGCFVSFCKHLKNNANFPRVVNKRKSSVLAGESKRGRKAKCSSFQTICKTRRLSENKNIIIYNLFKNQVRKGWSKLYSYCFHPQDGFSQRQALSTSERDVFS